MKQNAWFTSDAIEGSRHLLGPTYAQLPGRAHNNVKISLWSSSLLKVVRTLLWKLCKVLFRSRIGQFNALQRTGLDVFMQCPHSKTICKCGLQLWQVLFHTDDIVRKILKQVKMQHWDIQWSFWYRISAISVQTIVQSLVRSYFGNEARVN